MAESKGKGGRGEEPTTSTPAKKRPEDFIFGKIVGEGSFSSVYLAKDVKTRKEFAIKVCDKKHIIQEGKAESIRREKEVLSILSAHRDPTTPFFVHLYATFQDHHRLYFVLTFAYGGELLKQLNARKRFSKKVAQFYGGEVVQALRHLHRLEICHRDLKPENILLNEEGHILITDFGSAKKLNSIPRVPSDEPSKDPDRAVVGRGRSNSFVGTAQYVSPEVLLGKYSDVGPAVDLWAFGCLLYQFLAGMTPFQAGTEFLIFKKILSLDYEFPDNVDEDAKDLISSLLKIQFVDRLGALDTEPYTSIQTHPFFEGIDFDKLYSQKVPFGEDMDVADSKANPLKVIKIQIPDDYEPGFNPRVIAERFLRSSSETDLSWKDESKVSSDESEESESTPGATSESDTASTTEFLNAMSNEAQQTCEDKHRGDGDHMKPLHSFTMVSATAHHLTTKGIFPCDSQERNQRLEEQAEKNPGWHKAVKGNLILKQGVVTKRKGLFSRRRMLLLTEGPHLYYCDPNTMIVKGEIPWSPELRPDAKDFKSFHVYTPRRTYYLEDPSGYALSWCDTINQILQHGQLQPNNN